ncbi:hypothetical protein ACFVZH_20730 [Streptomyces sp. NPDC059534]|uniref:hypothetical protein n=1 Tax=Streptomyces sp. NPDC059534 TaxID=3346859 RepID=UPI00368185B1
MTSAAQPPLWADGWEKEADRKTGRDPDEQAFLDLHAPRAEGGGRLIVEVPIVLEVL